VRCADGSVRRPWPRRLVLEFYVSFRKMRAERERGAAFPVLPTEASGVKSSRSPSAFVDNSFKPQGRCLWREIECTKVRVWYPLPMQQRAMMRREEPKRFAGVLVFAEKAHKPNQETAAAPVNPKQDSPVPSQSQRESQHAQQHHTMMTKQQNEDDDKDELRLRYREYALAIPFLHTVRRQHDLPSASAIAFRVGLCRLVECVHPSHQQIHANPTMRPLDATGPRWRSGQRNWQQ